MAQLKKYCKMYFILYFYFNNVLQHLFSLEYRVNLFTLPNLNSLGLMSDENHEIALTFRRILTYEG